MQIFIAVCELSFNCLIMPFAEQKVFILIMSSLSTPSFTNCAFGVMSKRYHQTQSHLDFLLLSARSFIVVCLTLRSVNHSDLCVAKGVRSMSAWISSCSRTSSERKYHLFTIIFSLFSDIFAFKKITII